MLCFPLDGDNAISREDYTAIAGWVSGVTLGVEVSGPTLPDLTDIDVTHVGIKDRSLASEVVALGKIPILHVSPSFILEVEDGSLPEDTIYVVEMGSNDTDPDWLKSFSSGKTLYVGGELAMDVDQILLDGVAGLYLKGQTEEQPGFKDYDQLAEILEQLEVD